MGGLGRGDPGLAFQYEFNTVLFPIEPGVTSYAVKSSDDELLASNNIPAGVFTINLMGRQSGEPPLYDGQHIIIADPFGKLSPGTSFHVVGKLAGTGAQIAVGGVPTDFINMNVAGEALTFIYSAYTNTWNVIEGGGGGGGGLPLTTAVPRFEDLTALTAASYRNGAKVDVDTFFGPGQLNRTSSATPDGITVVATNDAIGNWERVPITSPKWSEASSWYVDAVLGNDQNLGTAADKPLKTMAEWCRRVRSMTDYVAYNINLLTNIPSSDAFVPSGWNQNQGVFDLGGIFVIGSRTPIVGATGLPVTAANDTDPTSGPNGVQASITSGVLDFTPYIGKVIVVTTGANAGATAAVGKQTNVLGVALVGNWNGGAPSPGDLFDIVEFTTFAAELANKGSDGNIQFSNCFFPDVAFNLDLLAGPRIEFDHCRFECDYSWGDELGGRTDVTNCVFLNPPGGTVGGFAGMHGGQQLFANSTFINANFLSQCPSTVLTGNTFFGGGIKLDGVAKINFLSFPFSSTGVFDAPGDALEVTRNSVAFPGGGGPSFLRRILYGSGTTPGFGNNVHDGGVLDTVGAASCVTGVSGDISFEGSATVIPPLVAGAVVPAAVPLVTYADLAAAGGNVMSYSKGSRIASV